MTLYRVTLKKTEERTGVVDVDYGSDPWLVAWDEFESLDVVESEEKTKLFARLCDACKTELNDDRKFCPMCGGDIEPA